MKSPQKNTLLFQLGFTLLLVVLMVAAGFEISTAFHLQQSWESLFTPLQSLTIILAALLLIAGLAALFILLWKPGTASRLAKLVGKLRWVILAGCLIFTIWFFLFSTWQVVFVGTWTRYLFLLGLAALIGLSSGDERGSFGWREVLLALTWLAYIGMVEEARHATPFAAVYRGLTALGALLAAAAALGLYHSGHFISLRDRLAAWRDRYPWLRWIFGLLLASAPMILLGIEGRDYFAANLFARLLVFLAVLPGLAVMVSREKGRLATREAWIAAAGILLFTTAVSNYLTSVTTDPFSMGWSEGNRFYDYSLSFASKLYNYPGKLAVPYFAPGRYALWGWLFLIPGLPIWVHRLWNVILQAVPALLAGWLIARLVRNSRWYLVFAVWMTLYLLQGVIQPPLLVAALIILPFLLVKNPWIRGSALVAASLYAGLSRWTWVAGIGAWGALIELFVFYPQRKGTFFRRISPAIILALLGILPGILAGWHGAFQKTGALTASQPLLWYRLWPNATYPPGIVEAILLASGPLVILLVWLAASRRWKMDWLQATAAAGAALVFLGAGIVISMKIGGGGDLHNLDMFTLTTALLAGLAAFALHRTGSLAPATWPRWAQVILALCLLIPAWNAWNVDSPIQVPDKNTQNAWLGATGATVSSYQGIGEVLFMDQRQLLTFGYLPAVPFTPDYEKKYMMDQAMAGNAAYFAQYYQDLAHKRFALIITEPLTVHHAGSDNLFGEENDAWVNWVSAPTLCFYRPLYLAKEINVEFLVPSEHIEACARYVKP